MEVRGAQQFAVDVSPCLGVPYLIWISLVAQQAATRIWAVFVGPSLVVVGFGFGYCNK